LPQRVLAAIGAEPTCGEVRYTVADAGLRSEFGEVFALLRAGIGLKFSGELKV